MNKIRFAIIGCGRIAERHAMHIHTFGKLISVCDIEVSKAITFADKYSANYFCTIEKLLCSDQTIDVVVICTPNGLHAKHAILALQKGFHVLVEKPMALSENDCKLMMEAAKNSDKQLFTVMQNRFNPPVAAVKKAIDENAFGKISSIQLTCFWNRNNDYYKDSWKGTSDMDGGILFTQFSHFIDLLYWLFGDVKEIRSIIRNADHLHTIEFEDSGVAILAFENGSIGTINFSINSFAKNREGSLSILGDKGTVKIGGEYLNTIEYQEFEDYSIEQEDTFREANDYGTYKGSMSNHDKVYENLIQTLQSNATFYATHFEGFKTVEIIERIYNSAKNR